MPVWFRVAAAVGLLLLGRAAPAADAPADAALVRTAKALFANLKSETLPNGLRVYLLPVPGAPVVTTMVAYKVGSADEDKDQTGLSHYLEHLLFKGTEKLLPGDIDRATQRNGGRNNAYTSEDMTCYHFDFAADRWTIGLDIEADRMRNVRIDEKHEFQQEKGAVVAELKGNEDGPWDLEYKTILPMLFPKAAPYAHPVIGEEKHVRAASAEVIKRHYDKWYHPNNASIVVVGGFDPADAMTRIKTLFGPIPKGDLPPRKVDPPKMPRATLTRTEFTSKFDVPRLMIGFNGVRIGDPEDYILDVIDDILATGKTSRLYKKLVDGEHMAGSVGASNSAGRYPGWYGIQVELIKGKDRKKVEELVFAELKKLAAEPVSQAELARVRRSNLAAFVFSRESVHSLADFVAKSVTTADPAYIDTYLDKVLAVTPADVQRVAAKLLRPEQAVVVWSVPEDEKPGAGAGKPEKPTPARKPMKARFRDTPAPAGSGFALKDAKRVVLPNGLKLVVLENHRLPIVVAAASVADVRLRETAKQSGVAALVGEMLEEGTADHTADQIATLIEDTGGTLTLASGGGSVKVLAPDTELGLGLLFECLSRPTFPADELAAKKDQLLASIADAETQPQNRARNLFNAAVYGDHPYGRPGVGKKEIVEKLTAADCKAFHASAFGPDVTTVVIVGDVDTAAIEKVVAKLTANWKPLGAKPPVPAAPPPAQFTEAIVTDPTAAQTHVYIGQLGILRNNPDYYRLLVMDNVLGTGPGFTDRLSSTLRDRQGLAYTVTATITPSAGDQPGAFTGYIGTFPDKFVWVRDGFLKEVRKLRDEAPTAGEVEDAKKYLLGSMPFRLATTEQVAGELLAAEKYGLGFDVMETFRTAVAGVTPADVQKMAKQYLDPAKFVVVAVGPIDSAGRPLPAKKGGPEK